MADLYEEDILLWSQHQAALLRRIAAGEVVNERPDWGNIIEEVESVGRSDLRAVQSLLRQALVHILKAQAWPNSLAAPSWESDAWLFRAQARDAFSPAMRQHIDLVKLYSDAVRALPRSVDGQPPLPVPGQCRMTLDELLFEEAPERE